MAHGDYECCAVCDSKMGYDPDCDSKNVLCSSCAVDLAQKGVFVHNVAELMEWMEKTPCPYVVTDTLQSVGFRQCLYPNAVDKLYLKRLFQDWAGGR